jgi:hypothetical protein
MDWPARSPDINPIEHIWDMLGKRVKARIPAPQTTQALQTMLLEEWDNLPQELIDNSIRTMPRRIIARGGNMLLKLNVIAIHKKITKKEKNV